MKPKIYYENERVPAGHTCYCGKKHRWPLYIYAHKHDSIIHTCDECQRQVCIVELDVEKVKKN